MKDQILVLGGTGKTGRRVAQRLEAQGIPVRIGSRSAEPAFDWENSSNWKRVLTGIDKVYITVMPDLASPGSVEKTKLFVEEAKAAGVLKLVLLSGRGEPEAQACEDAVAGSGIDFTVLRAAWFMQNFSESFLLDSILAGEVVLPKVETSEPFVDLDDLADVAVAALTTDNHTNTLIEITGPELLTFKQAVAEIAGGLQREIKFTEVTLTEYVAILRSYGIDDDYIELVEYLFLNILDGRNAHVVKDLEEVLGRKATTFKEYVEKTSSTGVWSTSPAYLS